MKKKVKEESWKLVKKEGFTACHLVLGYLIFFSCTTALGQSELIILMGNSTLSRALELEPHHEI